MTNETDRWRLSLAHWIERPAVHNTLIALIVVNAIILGMATSTALMARWGGLLRALDTAILAVFVVEIALRIAAHRLAFFRDPWSVFDFLVVGIALLPATGPFAVLRALRVLRVLRLLTMVPSMRRVVAGLLAAIPGLTSVIAIIAIIFYVAAVIATQLFGDRFPDWFGTLGESAYTLFQVMTLESWSMGIARPVIETYPYAWIFFVLFIMVSTFTMLNLFIAIIVNAMQSYQEAEAKHTEAVVTARIDADTRELQSEIAALRAEIGLLRRDLGREA
ncbi:MAG: ion transporter [Sterolibacteriaceae bacterium]|uniref:Ion transporter n=1 Tax=Candidatus Methylophosphatis roskildensis TaxID=2899263 RepID=A0A9D7E540_9PROT|nr:ion transporter [Candidatus Methylophosphatis roskildensis]